MFFTAGFFNLEVISSYFKTKKGWLTGVVPQNGTALIAVVSPKCPLENSARIG